MQRAARAITWYGVVPLWRMRARRRLSLLTPGAVTVVTVNWNSWRYLSVLIDMVKRQSPEGTSILVVDNASVDGSLERLNDISDVSSLRLPFNLGHDIALDLGVLSCHSEYVVTLDVDAFPLHERWLDEILAPLQNGSEISGARLWRPFVHPCCLAMRTARFITKNHSFRSYYQPRQGSQEPSGDVGELMSERETPKLYFFPPTSQRGPGDVGTVFGHLVYHNFYCTRFNATKEAVLDQQVTVEAPELAWREALERYVK